jgi:hypothetical protein
MLGLDKTGPYRFVHAAYGGLEVLSRIGFLATWIITGISSRLTDGLTFVNQLKFQYDKRSCTI